MAREPQWTEQVDAEADQFFRTLSQPEIRRRQRLAKAQIESAFREGNTVALEDLNKMNDALGREMLRRLSE